MTFCAAALALPAAGESFAEDGGTLFVDDSTTDEEKAKQPGQESQDHQ